VIHDPTLGRTNRPCPVWSSSVANQAGAALSGARSPTQDDIRITRKLTLNLGLRYDYETPRTERYNRLAFFNPTAPSPIAAQVNMPNLAGGLDYVAVNTNPRGWTEPDRNNFGLRFGLANQAFSRTVVRGGYGLTYLPNGTSFNAYGAGQEGFSATTVL
jgi:hypothetical protein